VRLSAFSRRVASQPSSSHGEIHHDDVEGLVLGHLEAYLAVGGDLDMKPACSRYKRRTCRVSTRGLSVRESPPTAR